MTLKGCDYSWGRPDPAQLYAAGYRFAIRYLSHDTTGKNITASEARALHANGLDVVLVWEQGANAAIGGYTQGRNDAASALSMMVSIGMPAGTVVYFAVDWDARQYDMTTIANYLQGASSVLGYARVGVYGSYSVIEAMAHGGWCAWFWQTYAWSGGLWSDHAHIHQIANNVPFQGATIDIDIAFRFPYGASGAIVDQPSQQGQGGNPLSGWPACSMGHTTPAQTRTVQGLLLARGYDDIGSADGRPDGDWGPHTDASFRSFQVQHHVPNSVRSDGTGDGICGDNSLRALVGM